MHHTTRHTAGPATDVNRCILVVGEPAHGERDDDGGVERQKNAEPDVPEASVRVQRPHFACGVAHTVHNDTSQ